LIGNGRCDRGEANTEACEWDGGDCAYFNAKFSNCTVGCPFRIVDGRCDRGEANTESCGWWDVVGIVQFQCQLSQLPFGLSPIDRQWQMPWRSVQYRVLWMGRWDLSYSFSSLIMITCVKLRFDVNN